MKVGYLRFSNPVELDFSNASTSLRGTEYRLGVLEALVANGFDVSIYSPVKKDHKHVLEGKAQRSMGKFLGDDENDVDYTFMKDVEYEPEARDIDADILLIECGPTSTLFGYNWDVPNEYSFSDNVPFIWRTFDVIDNFEGHVIYHQHDIKLGFPFNEASREPSEEAESERNLTIMGSHVDFFENKRWTILLHSLNPQRVYSYYSTTNRYNYGDFPLAYHVIPACYSENVDLRFEPRELGETEHDLLYIGGAKDESRKNRIRELYAHENHTAGIIGGWEDEDREDVAPELIHYYGRKGGHQDVYRLQNWGLSTVNVADDFLAESGQITNRVVSSARAGCIVMIDGQIYGANRYVDDRFIVDNKDDVNDALRYLKGLSYEERCQLNERQMDQLPKWKEIPWTDVFSFTPDMPHLSDESGTTTLDTFYEGEYREEETVKN